MWAESELAKQAKVLIPKLKKAGLNDTADSLNYLSEKRHVLWGGNWKGWCCESDIDSTQNGFGRFEKEKTMNAMQEVVNWVRTNAKLSHDAPDLVIGRFGKKMFRIFVREGFAGAAKVQGLMCVVDVALNVVCNWRIGFRGHSLTQTHTDLAQTRRDAGNRSMNSQHDLIEPVSFIPK